MSPTPAYTVRACGADAIPILVESRHRMCEDMGETNLTSLEASDTLFAEWLAQRFSDGRVIGYVAETPEGSWVGAVTAHVQEVAPGLNNPSGLQHYLLGLWVRPEWRRRGVATALASAAVEGARAVGVGVVSLTASDEGRLVYERMGFEAAPGMRVLLDPRP